MRLDYLEDEACDCPIVRFYLFNPKEVRTLLEVALLLFKGQASRVDLLPLVDSEKVRRFDLVSGAAVGIRSEAPWCFEWELEAFQWAVVASLLEPFADGSTNESSFQWLAGRMADPPVDQGEISVLISETGKW